MAASDAHRLGDVGQGLSVALSFLDYSRVSLSNSMVGLSQRALNEAVAFARRRGESFTSEAATAKLFSLNMIGRGADLALLVHGGFGYTVEAPIERIYRDARSFWFEEGTAEIQQLVVARSVFDASDEGSGSAQPCGSTKTFKGASSAIGAANHSATCDSPRRCIVKAERSMRRSFIIATTRATSPR
ncbi:MAG: acyl-CoA dehydrogenase family protein [Nocardioides sp.]|uniref:acyl-CoA dehydrogenase family protein n=1 Tax=Nocardioides sp. TaxID=35761 RepID=UPI003267B580